MIARVRCAAHAAVDAGRDKSLRQRRAHQQMVEPQARVAFPAPAEIMPERVHRRVRVQRPDGVGPALIQDARESRPALRLHQRVLRPGFAWIDVERSRHDVVVAREHGRDVILDEAGGVLPQPFEPGELVVEFRPGLRIPVRRVEAADQDPADRGFEVAALPVGRIAGEGGARDERRGAARQDRDAVPALLALPDRAITRRLDRSLTCW